MLNKNADLVCYYCDKTFTIGKKAKGDHVLPDAIGGRVSFLNVCKICNERLNKEIDSYLIKKYKPLTILYGIKPTKNKNYNKNELEFNEFCISDLPVKIRASLSSGGIRVKNQVINIDNKRTRIFPNIHHKEEYLSSKRRYSFDNLYVPTPNATAIGTGTREIFPPDHNRRVVRSLTKSCLNLIGKKKGLNYLNSLNLNQAKNIVLGNIDCLEDDILQITDSDKQIYREFCHVIKIYKERDMLIGLVFLFGNHRKIILARSFNKEFNDIIEYFPYTPQENF